MTTTPCPQPRLGGLRRPSILAQEPNQDFTRSFRDAKPRRRNSNRPSFGWDPTLDIYDDTFALSKPVQLPQNARNGPKFGQSLGQPRRTTLFAQPAQRPQHVTNQISNQSDDDAKRRRMSTFQSAASAATASSVNVIATLPEIKKDPRRRTIYVPSDDTTIMTIHPGANISRRERPVERPTRSDIFEDLAVLPEESGEPPQDSHAYSRKPPRRSLAVAPRRVPLQQSAQAQLNHNMVSDVPGSGEGKENVPPGASLSGTKQARRSSIFSKVNNSNNSSQCLAKPLSKPSSHMSVVREEDSPNQVSTAEQKRQNAVQGDSIRNARKLPTSSSLQAPQTLGEPNIQRRISSIHGSTRTHSQPYIDLLPSKLNVPSFAHRKSIAPPTRYPVLTEDIRETQMYEDNWLSHQEMAVTQLINSLFGSNTDKIINRRKSTRKALLSMYQEPAMPLLYKRLQASLRFGALSIPPESMQQVTRFRDDVGQKQRFLDLWLKTYNLSSLQSVAEVVIGRQVPSWKRTSNSQSPESQSRQHAKALEAFLKTFLISNEDKTQRRQTTTHLKSTTYPTQACANGSLDGALSWRYTVLRSLMMVLLLDKGQQAGVFKQCLFQKMSPFKSSSSVLQSLSVLLLPSIGDVGRVLGHLNYTVRHIQNSLQEHEYHISNLATDMRDGVLLARLAEILLYPTSINRQQDHDVTVTLPEGEILASSLDSNHGKSWVLSRHLKYPCISRVQKMYNVQISLSALSGVEDINHCIQNLRPEDIVDGHREKTVGLLWNLVGRWGLEALLDFNLVEKEILRLKKELCEKKIESEAEFTTTLECENYRYLTGLERCTALLRTWASCIGRLHGLMVTNLSSSFADGKVYNAITTEYRQALKSCNTFDGSMSRVDFDAQSGSTSMTLKALGCSQAFADMFRGEVTMPSAQTTVPLLAFLASRLLPLSEPYFAATKIQRAWRVKRSRDIFRQRLVLAYLANSCAAVVQTRERLIWAVLVLQRRWRAILRSTTGRYANSLFWKVRLPGNI